MESTLNAVRLRHVVFPAAIGHLRAVNFQLPPEEPAIDPDDASAIKSTRPEEREFFAWLFARVGLDVRNYRIETLARRLPACLRVLRAPNVERAQAVLEHHPALCRPAIDALVIGVTSFFRDEPVFDALEQQILPELADRRPPGRIWSVGCSSGAELYSVAMLLDEMGVLDAFELLGTDCRDDAIEAARAGLYGSTETRTVSPQRLHRHFHRELPKDRDAGEKWRVVQSIRRAVQWHRGDALRQVEPGSWDLILCRNLMMYLTTEAAARMCRCFERSLRPGGILVLGKAERPPVTLRFAPVGPPCLFRRESGA